MEAYTYLAKYYDILMKDFNYDAYIKHIEKYVKGEGVDLCCGSGTMTLKLSKLNAKMIGVDISESMLNEARDKARLNSKNILFIQSDILKFKPPHKVDFVTCVCDGINYIKQDKLEKLIETIVNYVKKDGYFIFDISTEHKLVNILANNVFCEDSDKVTYIWNNKYVNNSIKMELSFFEEVEKGLYKRFEEYHTQYVHQHEDILKILDQYFNIEVLDGQDFSEYTSTSKRALYILKRK